MVTSQIIHDAWFLHISVILNDLYGIKFVVGVIIDDGK